MTVRPTLHLSIPARNLTEAREFYCRQLGLEIGRVRDTWFDVWFFGLQLSIQLAPDETPVKPGGVRHFGVTLPDRAEFDAVIDWAEGHGIEWLSPPTRHSDEFSSKTAAFAADPSGNVIEFKLYEDGSDWLPIEQK